MCVCTMGHSTWNEETTLYEWTSRLNTEQSNPKKEYAVYDSIHIKWTEKLIYTVQNQDDDMKGFGNAGDILFKDLSSGYMDMSSL